MFIIAVLNLIKIYQTRHADINPHSARTFSFLATIIFITVIGVVCSIITSLFTSLNLLVFRSSMVLDLVLYRSYYHLLDVNNENLLYGKIESDNECSCKSSISSVFVFDEKFV